jgi:hypothetical protein
MTFEETVAIWKNIFSMEGIIKLNFRDVNLKRLRRNLKKVISLSYFFITLTIHFFAI